MDRKDWAQRETFAPYSFGGLCAPQDRIWLLIAAILASSLGFIDSSVTATSMPAMRASLGASLQGAQWMSNAYLLVLSSLVLAGGAAGDRFGVARVFRTGIVIFVAASLGCALAQNTGQMITARAVKGLGAALMVPGSMALIGRIYPRAERGRALGLWAAASTAATALGPILGGLLLGFSPEWGWRVIFAINLPIGILAWWLLKTHAKRDFGRPGTPVDWLGALLATAALGLLSVALTTPGPIALWAGPSSAIGLLLFVVWQVHNPHPMMPLRLFRAPGFASANLATFFLYFALTGVMFYLPMTALSAWGVSEIEVTAAFVPTSLMIGLLSAPAGRLADKVGAAPLIAAGAGLVAVAYGILAATVAQSAFWVWAVPATVLSGFGMALVVAPLTAAVMAAVEDADQGAASGINNAVARVAGMLAVAALGSLAAWAYGDQQPGFGIPADTSDHLAATARAFGMIAGIASFFAAIASAIALMGRTRPATSG